MNYFLHPEAAAEHRRQVAYYEKKQKGLGERYHAEFKKVVEGACAAPKRYRVVHSSDIR